MITPIDKIQLASKVDAIFNELQYYIAPSITEGASDAPTKSDTKSIQTAIDELIMINYMLKYQIKHNLL